MHFIAVEVFICLFMFDYKVLLVCVKDRTCLRIAISAYCFNIFGSIFGVLFCLLTKKLILGCKTIWQGMRKFPCAVWSVNKTAHWYGLNFSDNYLFSRPENLKQVWTFSHKLLYEKRYRLSLCPNDIHTFWLFITLCNMPKGLAK